MDHIFGNVAAGKLPEETPVDVLVGVEFGLGATVKEELPVDVLKVAVVGDGANPLTVTAGRVARDPRLDHGDFAEMALRDPIPGVGHAAGAYVLDADLDDLLGSLGGFLALDGLRNVPGHGFFAVEVFTSMERGDKVLGVEVHRRGVDDSVEPWPWRNRGGGSKCLRLPRTRCWAA